MCGRSRALVRLSSRARRAVRTSHRYLFHYVSENGIVYLCMADEEFGRRVPFNFLEDISKRFKTTYGDRGRTAMAYSLNEEFSRVLARQMVRPPPHRHLGLASNADLRSPAPARPCAIARLQDYYSNPQGDKLNEVKGEIAAVKEVMVQNIGTTDPSCPFRSLRSRPLLVCCTLPLCITLPRC